jgi:predicted DNA binding CopG/RHH family protein
MAYDASSTIKPYASSTPIDPDDIEQLADAELDEATARRVAAMTADADREVEELRVTIRWGRSQMGVIRRAARQMGIPYQSYVKQAALRQAIADLKEGAVVGFEVGTIVANATGDRDPTTGKLSP